MTKKCEVCLSFFNVKPCHYHKRFCCSKECKKERFKYSQSGSNNPNYKGRDKIVHTCFNCGLEFYAKRPQFPTKCCSKKCSTIWVGKQKSGKRIPKEIIDRQKINHRETLAKKGVIDPKIRRTCLCGNKKDDKAKTCVSCFKLKISFTPKPCVICGVTHKKRNTKTCSKQCYSKMRALQSSGDKNPNWRGGIKPENQRQRNHLSYKEWRRNVYIRDSFTCQDCGATKCYLHAHHIRPFSLYPELRTSVENGKTLCISCHKKYHPSMNIKKYKNQILIP